MIVKLKRLALLLLLLSATTATAQPQTSITLTESYQLVASKNDILVLMRVKNSPMYCVFLPTAPPNNALGAAFRFGDDQLYANFAVPENMYCRAHSGSASVTTVKAG